MGDYGGPQPERKGGRRLIIQMRDDVRVIGVRETRAPCGVRKETRRLLVWTAICVRW